MASISEVTITQDILKNPKNYPTYRFGENYLGKLCCPISLEEFKENETVYKVDCCKYIIKKESLTAALMSLDNCPMCRKRLNVTSVLKGRTIEERQRIASFELRELHERLKGLNASLLAQHKLLIEAQKSGTQQEIQDYKRNIIQILYAQGQNLLEAQRKGVIRDNENIRNFFEIFKESNQNPISSIEDIERAIRNTMTQVILEASRSLFSSSLSALLAAQSRGMGGFSLSSYVPSFRGSLPGREQTLSESSAAPASIRKDVSEDSSSDTELETPYESSSDNETISKPHEDQASSRDTMPKASTSDNESETSPALAVISESFPPADQTNNESETINRQSVLDRINNVWKKTPWRWILFGAACVGVGWYLYTTYEPCISLNVTETIANLKSIKDVFFNSCLNETVFPVGQKLEAHCAKKYIFSEECKKIVLDYLKIPVERIVKIDVADLNLSSCSVYLRKCSSMFQCVKERFFPPEYIGKVFEYAKSNFLQRLCSTSGINDAIWRIQTQLFQ